MLRKKGEALNPIVVIPARMASTRLPRKPLADIGGQPMIVRVWRAAQRAALGPVVVAAAEAEIAKVITEAGGKAVLTDPALPSGTDRVHAALRQLDHGAEYDSVINLQGDLPTLDPEDLRLVSATLSAAGTDMATLVAEIHTAYDGDNPNVVKAVIAWGADGKRGRALYFTRSRAPHGTGPLFHHIGIYAYTRPALTKFVLLPPSPLEQREKLEQLRALEAGMTIAVARTSGVPLSVDTPEDLEKARALLRNS